MQIGDADIIIKGKTRLSRKNMVRVSERYVSHFGKVTDFRFKKSKLEIWFKLFPHQVKYFLSEINREEVFENKIIIDKHNTTSSNILEGCLTLEKK